MSQLIRNQIDWAQFLSRHDLNWPELSYRGGHELLPKYERTYKSEWDEGAFLGNGMIGAMISKDCRSALKWELGRNDVVAHQHLQQIDWCIPRVPIGEIIVRPVGAIIEESMTLSLWNAEASGKMVTDAGRVEWISYTHANEDCLVIDVSMEAGEQGVEFGFRPLHGISPRIPYESVKPHPSLLPPMPVQLYRAGIHYSIQSLITQEHPAFEGIRKECVVAWKEVQMDSHRKLLYLTITHTDGEDNASERAEAILTQATKQSPDDYAEAHRTWWHSYYPASFVSIPDTRWESIYWIQMYKLACATRDSSTIIDNQGPWLTQTPWPGTWWNLNVQLAYSPVYKANRLHLGESLIRNLEKRADTLRSNAQPLGLEDGMYLNRTSSHDLVSPCNKTDFEFGNLPWALHNVWRHYRSTMDDEFLRNRLFPLLRSSMNVYLHMMYIGEDDRWHLPRMCSPEYPSPDDGTSNRGTTENGTRDCNYDLALFRWGCSALLEANELLRLSDPLEGVWRAVLARLTDYPCDTNGLMVGAELPFATSHRHYSHLLMIYPLHTLHPDRIEDHELIRKSVEHWMSFPDALQGYSFTGAACMAATMGNGSEALAYLNGLREFLLPHTMYSEHGPVLETPLSSAEAIHYLLMQCWGGVVRIFPAVPPEWTEAAFANLLAEGAFEISAVRKAGKTEFVCVKSLAGLPLTLMPNFTSAMSWRGSADIRVEKHDVEGTYRIYVPKGESVYLYEEGMDPDWEINAVAPQVEYLNYYGSRK